MTLSEGALNRPRAGSDKLRARKFRRRKKVGSGYSPKGISVPRRKRGRQRFDAAISMEGRPRLRLPALRLIRSGARIPALILLGIAAWGLMTIYTSPDFEVTRPEITGIEFVSPSRIRTIVGVRGRSIFEVDPVEILEILEALPEIKSARVEVQWPNKVLIELEERQPVLAWNDGGQSWLLSADGLAFYMRDSIPGMVHVHSLTAVLELGEPLEPAIEKEKIKAAYDLSLLLNMDSPLLFDPHYGFGFRDDRGWMAYFGTSGDMTIKFGIYNEIAEKLAREGYPATLVSVANLEGIFYR
jgi:hypothetical protein